MLVQGRALRALYCALSMANPLPVAAVIFMSASNTVNCWATISLNPLNTDNVHTMAIVASVTPATAMPDMILITRCPFFEKR